MVQNACHTTQHSSQDRAPCTIMRPASGGGRERPNPAPHQCPIMLPYGHGTGPCLNPGLGSNLMHVLELVGSKWRLPIRAQQTVWECGCWSVQPMSPFAASKRCWLAETTCSLTLQHTWLGLGPAEGVSPRRLPSVVTNLATRPTAVLRVRCVSRFSSSRPDLLLYHARGGSLHSHPCYHQQRAR